MMNNSPNFRSYQQGVGTLIFSIFILALISIVSFNGLKAVMKEQKMMANDARSKQAFETAESGIARALQYYSNGVDQDDNGLVDPAPYVVNGNNVASTTINANRVDFAIVGSNTNLETFTISVTGYSDDLTAKRTITETIGRLNPLPTAPTNPMVSRGMVNITGSATVSNPEGFSTVWSGGDVDFTSNNSMSTQVPDMAHANYPVCTDSSESCSVVRSSDKDMVGPDVIEFDSSLANLTPEQVFENFFGMAPARYRKVHVDEDVDNNGLSALASDNSKNNGHGKIIWVEGNSTLPFSLIGCTSEATNTSSVTNKGCAEANLEPSIIIVNGDVSLSNFTFYGILFVLGTASGNGSPTIHGSMIVAGDGANNMSGSVDIVYNSMALNKINSSSNSNVGGAGTWRDF